jgi:putative two-component system response regulator
MDNEGQKGYPELYDQLIRYAQDLAVVFRGSKDREQELDSVTHQLSSFAVDLKKVHDKLHEQYEVTKAAHLDTIYRLALAAEYRDQETGNHIKRMSRYSAVLAERMGMKPSEVELMLYSSPMHDIGKIGIPDSILLKPGKLTEGEFEIIKSHTVIGARILEDSKSEVIQYAQVIALNHHEKWNGQGYPNRLKRAKIPLPARIVGLVDVFDALTTKRPYKDAYPVELACDIIERERGQSFDPDVVDAFTDGLDAILEVRQQYQDADDASAGPAALSERDRQAGNKATSRHNNV